MRRGSVGPYECFSSVAYWQLAIPHATMFRMLLALATVCSAAAASVNPNGPGSGPSGFSGWFRAQTRSTHLDGCRLPGKGGQHHPPSRLKSQSSAGNVCAVMMSISHFVRTSAAIASRRSSAAGRSGAYSHSVAVV